MSRRRVDIEIVWGDRPATSPVGPDAPPIVRVERTDPARPFTPRSGASEANILRMAPSCVVEVMPYEEEP